MFSDDVWEQFNEDMDDLLEFEPVEESDVKLLFNKIEGFRSGGGVAAWLEGRRTLTAVDLGLSENNMDKLTVLGNANSGGDSIYYTGKKTPSIVLIEKLGRG
jgi:hypothetical protein